jgi:hypothetical protein
VEGSWEGSNWWKKVRSFLLGGTNLRGFNRWKDVRRGSN